VGGTRDASVVTRVRRTIDERSMFFALFLTHKEYIDDVLSL
jgi:hypothetical protein